MLSVSSSTGMRQLLNAELGSNEDRDIADSSLVSRTSCWPLAYAIGAPSSTLQDVFGPFDFDSLAQNGSKHLQLGRAQPVACRGRRANRAVVLDQ